MGKWKTTILAISAMLVYWVFETIVHLLIIRTGTLSESLFPLHGHELWMRLWSMVLAGVVAIIVRKVIQANRVVKIMEGLIPICAWCKKKIRTEVGEWQNVDQYIGERGEVEFTHSMCPDCYEKTTGEKLVL